MFSNQMRHDPLSMKKNAVAANIPIEITQKEIPTKSSCQENIVAFAAPEKPIKATAAKAKKFKFFHIKNSSFVYF